MALRPITRPRERQAGEEDATAGVRPVKRAPTKRYAIILRIRHSDLDPTEITSALGWKPDRFWKAGDPALTPKGTKLPGARSDGLWSCAFRYKGDKHIAENLEHILDHLVTHKDLLVHLNEIGAAISLYLQLSGDSNIGDRIGWEVLKKFADLRIVFEFEVFPEWA